MTPNAPLAKPAEAVPTCVRQSYETFLGPGRCGGRLVLPIVAARLAGGLVPWWGKHPVRACRPGVHPGRACQGLTDRRHDRNGAPGRGAGLAVLAGPQSAVCRSLPRSLPSGRPGRVRPGGGGQAVEELRLAEAVSGYAADRRSATGYPPRRPGGRWPRWRLSWS